MAITSVKSTYALDVETVTTLERMAKHWKVSKSEALRRAIRIAAEAETGMNPEAIAALDELQGSLGMGAKQRSSLGAHGPSGATHQLRGFRLDLRTAPNPLGCSTLRAGAAALSWTA